MENAVPAEQQASPSLRIAVVVDRDWVYGWEREILEQAARIEGLDLASIVRISAPRQSEQRAGAWRLATALDNGISRLLFHRNYRRAGRDHDARTLLSALTVAAVVQSAEITSPSRAMNCEYLLDLTEGRSTAGTGVRPRLGTFRLEWGNPNPLTGKPDGAAEVLARMPYSACRLIFDPVSGEAPRALTRVYRTYLYSWSENARRLHWAGATLFLDCIRDLVKQGKQSQIYNAPMLAGGNGAMPSLTVSGALGTSAVALAAMAKRMFERMVQRLSTNEQWSIYLRRNLGSMDGIGRYTSWEHLVPPADRAWADPFIIERGGRTFIFAEELEYTSDKGVIVCLEHIQSEVKRLGVVLDEPHHLSYPFLFEHQGDLFMLPESSAGRELVLWRCVEFPMKWTRERVIFTGVAIVDATLVQKDGRWWMFATIDRIGGGDLTSELHAFYADDPVRGTWRSHDLNPLLVDACVARMGGTVAWRDGSLIRVSQGSGFEYGERLNLRRITELTPSGYAEEAIATFVPAPGDIGLHHFSSWNTVSVVDCCRRTRKAGIRGTASVMLPRFSPDFIDNARHDPA